MLDYILNGEPHGDVASTLLESEFDFGLFRPWKAKNGRSVVTTINKQGKLVNNYIPNPAVFTKDEWIMLDMVVTEVARTRLRAWGDLVGAGLTYNFDAMLSPILQYQTVSESGTAQITMDGLGEAERSRPQYDLRGLPMPIIHSDFWFGSRELGISRKGRQPLDTVQLKNSTRRITEMIEDLVIGNVTPYSYAGYTIPGYTTQGDRIVFDITDPTSSGWSPSITYDEVLDMREQARLVHFYGPFLLYMSATWERFLDTDYSAAYPGVTLRDKLSNIENIATVKTLDNLYGYQILLIPARDDVARAVTGMKLSTMQWPERGSMKMNFKVMCIMVPQVRSNYAHQNGLVHGNITD